MVSEVGDVHGLSFRNIPALMTTAIGDMVVVSWLFLVPLLEFVLQRQCDAALVSTVHRKCTSSLVTWACDPSGDNKVMELWADLFRPDSEGLFTGLPIPSRELSLRIRAKACGSDSLRVEETA
ncbi:unnamed protein product [Thlaspi arvense]|uniref:Uncharacterized protein n=1 Tax=Thlaspi arvense TaxID=13288 RepID=A0AAU9R8G4_THLAR|nr:unnamed protein product [Thlaspi arvense]